MIFKHEVKWGEVAQSCLTLCDPMGCSLPGFSVYGIFQARVLEWIAISFSGGPSRPRDWTRVFCIGCRRFTVWATIVDYKYVNFYLVNMQDNILRSKSFKNIYRNFQLPHINFPTIIFPIIVKEKNEQFVKCPVSGNI